MAMIRGEYVFASGSCDGVPLSHLKLSLSGRDPILKLQLGPGSDDTVHIPGYRSSGLLQLMGTLYEVGRRGTMTGNLRRGLRPQQFPDYLTVGQ